jgi:glycogen synthase kinase 3 beta
MCITRYGVEIDIWAAGCIFAEMFLLSPVFQGKSEGDQLFKIFEVLGSFTPLEAMEYKTQVPFDGSFFRQFEGYSKKNL